jgi:hypothetical protein
MNIIRPATGAVAVASLGALLLPMTATFGRIAAADEVVVGNVTTLRLFEHDTQQTTVDVGSRGPGPGDQFIFVGDVFDHAGGSKVGHTAGQCTTLSGNNTAGESMCTESFNLSGGQLTVQGLADTAAVFVRGETVPLAIVGGTGIYSNARGDGTVQVPPDVPNLTDANFVLNVITG